MVKVKGLIIFFLVNATGPLHKLLDIATSNFAGA